MDALLEQGDAARPLVCVIGAFVKRRSNLALICEGENAISADDLIHCLRESLEYLEGCGIVCAMNASANAQRTDYAPELRGRFFYSPDRGGCRRAAEHIQVRRGGTFDHGERGRRTMPDAFLFGGR